MTVWTPEELQKAYPQSLIIHQKAYDISEFHYSHPGGDLILLNVGQDCSDIFEAFHSDVAHEWLANFYIGDVMLPTERNPKETSFAKDMRLLSQQFKDMGLFRPNAIHYLTVGGIIILLWIAAFLSLYLLPSYYGPVLSVLCLSLFWQQCGWYSHDYLHHQVFQKRAYNDMVGYFFGNLCLGFSVSWWKNKHSTHHAQCNVHGDDPDIDTMPLIAWSEHALELFADIPENKAKLLVGYQAYLFFPILMFARLSWLVQSLMWNMPSNLSPVKSPLYIHRPTVERICLVLHHLWILCFVFGRFSLLSGIAYYVISQCLAGFLTGLVFSLNHSGCPIVSKDESKNMDWFTLQVMTSRDVVCSTFVNWFTGGLNLQIEHHLFPTMPRQNLQKAQPFIKTLCKKYGIPYCETTFFSGVSDVVQHLAKIARIF